jgi:hypothetical protein
MAAADWADSNCATGLCDFGGMTGLLVARLSSGTRRRIAPAAFGALSTFLEVDRSRCISSSNHFGASTSLLRDAALPDE